MFHTCEHFSIKELVPKDTYNKYRERAWMFIDPRLCVVLDELRKQVGPVVINSVAWDRNESGFRHPGCEYYSPTSQHSHGRAADCVSNSWEASNVRQKILSGEIQFSYPVTLEDNVSWLHIDVRNSTKPVTIFQP